MLRVYAPSSAGAALLLAGLYTGFALHAGGHPAPENIGSVEGLQAGWVFVYRHDHYWEQDWQVTPEWKKTFARACIDSGATAFISHGAPLLHGIEIYRRRPIFYDLGNFIFQLWTHLNGDLPARYRERVVR